MAASKILCAFVLFLAVSGSMAQLDSATEAKIIAACGMSVVSLATPATSCYNAVQKAPTSCPSSCKTVLKAVMKNAACYKAVLSAVHLTDAKVKKVSPNWLHVWSILAVASDFH